VAEKPVDVDAHPLALPRPLHTIPTDGIIQEAVELIRNAKHPIILAGNGISRSHAEQQLMMFAEQCNVPVATTFEGKGVFPDDHPNALGVVGFMHHDYENFAFDTADLILALGFSIQQFDPKKINPHNDKTIIHINTFVEDSDAHYSTALNIRADIGATLYALTAKLREQNVSFDTSQPKIRELLHAETISCANDPAFPMKPQRVVYDTRACGEKRLDDTGRYRCVEDVDGPSVPHVSDRHLSHRQLLVHHGLDAPGSCRRLDCAAIQTCARSDGRR
jgi:acetolactate synthase-1/2/3 large subunit